MRFSEKNAKFFPLEVSLSGYTSSMIEHRLRKTKYLICYI
jgi:hypothetical protein